jgi:O-antigen/teichoic acid export membrane protein
VGVTTAVGICVFVRPVLEVMADAAFWPAAQIVPVVVAAYLLQGLSSVVSFGIDVSERTKYVTYAMWISVLVVLALYALLIPPFGAMGAAVATLIAFAGRFALLYRFSQHLWPVTYQWRRPVRLVAMGSLATAPAFLFDLEGFLAKGFLGVGLGIGYMGLLWVTVLEPEDRRLLREGVRSSPRTILSRLVAS